MITTHLFPHQPHASSLFQMFWVVIFETWTFSSSLFFHVSHCHLSFQSLIQLVQVLERASLGQWWFVKMAEVESFGWVQCPFSSYSKCYMRWLKFISLLSMCVFFTVVLVFVWADRPSVIFEWVTSVFLSSWGACVLWGGCCFVWLLLWYVKDIIHVVVDWALSVCDYDMITGV